MRPASIMPFQGAGGSSWCRALANLQPFYRPFGRTHILRGLVFGAGSRVRALLAILCRCRLGVEGSCVDCKQIAKEK